jgi:hypothetical protein
MPRPRDSENLLRQLAEGVVSDPGFLPTETRQAIFSRSRRPGDGLPSPLPDPVLAFVDKVSEHAYKVTDRDFENLRHAGYAEGAIFEMAVCSAVGAGMARLDAGMQALLGGQ